MWLSIDGAFGAAGFAAPVRPVDVVGGALVVSDLRMATCDGQGRWQLQTPVSWPGAGVDSIRNPEALKLIMARIFPQQPPLPLEQWSREYLDGPAAEAGCGLRE